MISPTITLDIIAVSVSVISTIENVVSSSRLRKAIKDLHESHDELHAFVKRSDG